MKSDLIWSRFFFFLTNKIWKTDYNYFWLKSCETTNISLVPRLFGFHRMWQPGKMYDNKKSWHWTHKTGIWISFTISLPSMPTSLCSLWTDSHVHKLPHLTHTTAEMRAPQGGLITEPTRRYKKSHLLSLHGDKKSRLLSLHGDKKSRLLRLHGDKKSRLLSLHGDQKSHLLSLHGDKKSHLPSLHGDKKSHLLSPHGDKKSHLLSLEQLLTELIGTWD